MLLSWVELVFPSESLKITNIRSEAANVHEANSAHDAMRTIELTVALAWHAQTMKTSCAGLGEQTVASLKSLWLSLVPP